MTRGGNPDVNDPLKDPNFAAFAAQAAASMGIPDAGEQVREVYRNQMREIADQIPTRYEEPAYYWLMLSLAGELQETAQAMRWQVPPFPMFGTLPIGQFNALAIRVPDTDEHIIAFQEGVFGFVNLLTKSVAACYPVTEQAEDEGVTFSTDLEHVKESWARDDEPIDRLADFLGAYAVTGHPHAAEQYFLEHPFAALSGVMRHAAELFVLAHEFGHVISGHLAVENDDGRSLGPATVEVAPPSWEHEHQADYLGLLMTLTTMARTREVDPSLSYCGIDLLMTATQLVERAVTTISFGRPETSGMPDTHPPPQLRREVLRAALDDMCTKEQADAARNLATVSETILDLMWQQIEPSFVELHERGVRPSPIWSPTS